MKKKKLTKKQSDLIESYKVSGNSIDALKSVLGLDNFLGTTQLADWLAEKGVFAREWELAREYVIQKEKQKVIDFHVACLKHYVKLEDALELAVKGLQEGVTQNLSTNGGQKTVQDNLKIIAQVLFVDESLWGLVKYAD